MREEAVDFFPYIQHHEGALQSEQSFLLGAIQNAALLSLLGHPWFHDSFLFLLSVQCFPR